jgi:6,7-dimethyl-8-ribityllumazine synthase
MTHVYEGSFDGRRLRIGIVVARFNESVGKRLLDGALDGLRRHGVSDEDISIAWVPGAFEVPLVAQWLASSGEFDALVCLGAVIRGETAHFDYVAGESAAGISVASRKTGIPIANGILTTEDADQAIQRAGGKAGNKGFEAALAALEMANLLASLPKPSEGI